MPYAPPGYKMVRKLRKNPGDPKVWRLKPVVVKRKLRLGKPLATAVKAIVKRQAETKYITRLVENNVAHNSTIGQLDFYRIFPQLGSGTSEFTRVGDKISVQSLTLKGNVAISRSDAITQRNSAVMVRIIALQLKGAKTYTSAPALWATNSYYERLLKRNDDSGGGENAQFLGNQSELFLPVNREDFDVLGERFIKLTSLNAAGTTAGANSVEAAPIDSIAKNFNMKIKCPATIKFDGVNVQDPSMYAPFLCIGYAYMDGAGYDTVDTRIVVSAQSHLYFKDM